jgi:hypothetical protein
VPLFIFLLLKNEAIILLFFFFKDYLMSTIFNMKMTSMSFFKL